MLVICYNLGCNQPGCPEAVYLRLLASWGRKACKGVITAQGDQSYDEDWARSPEKGNNQPLGRGLLTVSLGSSPGGSQS